MGTGIFASLWMVGMLRSMAPLASVAPLPMRATAAEAALTGQTPSDELFQHAGEVAAQESRPISDQRGGAAFRRVLVRALTARCLNQAVSAINGR